MHWRGGRISSGWRQSVAIRCWSNSFRRNKRRSMHKSGLRCRDLAARCKELAALRATENFQKETQHEKFSKMCRFQAFWISGGRGHLACTLALRCGHSTKSSHRLECNSRHDGAQWKSDKISRLKYFWWHE